MNCAWLGAGHLGWDSKASGCAASRWVLMHDARDETEPSIEAIERMTPVGLLLIEGFKTHHYPKIEIHHQSEGKPLLCLEDPGIVAVASDVPLPDMKIPRLELNEPEAIADFTVMHAGLERAGSVRPAWRRTTGA